MIMSQHMQRSVNDQPCQLLLERDVAGTGFPLRDPGTDVDVSDEPTIRFRETKGQHISRTAMSEMAAIEFPHGVAAQECDRDARVPALATEHGTDDAFHSVVGKDPAAMAADAHLAVLTHDERPSDERA